MGLLRRSVAADQPEHGAASRSWGRSLAATANGILPSPDLRGRAPDRAGPGARAVVLRHWESAGRRTGDADHGDGSLLIRMAFRHVAAAATTNAPNGALPCRRAIRRSRRRGGQHLHCSLAAAVSLAPGQVAPVTVGGGAHNNLQPYLTLNWCIALQGVFPPRSLRHD